jgi:hypothetical protein
MSINAFTSWPLIGNVVNLLDLLRCEEQIDSIGIGHGLANHELPLRKGVEGLEMG